MQLLAWAMATGAPDGVATRSISSMRLRNGASSTIMAKAEVPAETLPVRGRTESVATMPVLAAPIGGPPAPTAAVVPGAGGCALEASGSEAEGCFERSPRRRPAPGTLG